MGASDRLRRLVYSDCSYFKGLRRDAGSINHSLLPIYLFTQKRI
jgi:hypothetical protein